MEIENFKSGISQAASAETSSHFVEEHQNVDFSAFLGEGFDNEFFADKMKTFPRDKMFEGWNIFLLSEEEDFHDKTIELDFWTTVVEKLTGSSDNPSLFPVFIQGLKSYYENKGVSDEHVTPERMQRFYDHMCASIH